MVFKYLNRKENRFDFLVPEGWKKYIYHQGTPFLGLKDWPWAIPLWILLTGFTLGYSPDFQLCDGEIVKYKEQQLCIDENWKWVAQLEFRVLDLIDAGKPEKADSLWNLG